MAKNSWDKETYLMAITHACDGLIGDGIAERMGIKAGNTVTFWLRKIGLNPAAIRRMKKEGKTPLEILESTEQFKPAPPAPAIEAPGLALADDVAGLPSEPESILLLRRIAVAVESIAKSVMASTRYEELQRPLFEKM